MFYQKFKYVIVLVTLFVLVQGQSIAQVPTPVDNFYVNGNVMFFGMPLSYFASPDMQQACTDLQSGRLSVAANAFSKKLHSDESNRAAWVGYLQAEPDYRTFYVDQLQQQTKKSPTQTNRFKLGVLAMYSLAELRVGKQSVTPTKQMLTMWKIAYGNLHDIYFQNHDLLTGICFYQLNSLLPWGYSAEQYPTPSYQDLFRLCIGDNEYDAFTQAKDNGWVSRVPSVPALSSNRLRMCSDFINQMIGTYATPAAVTTWISSTKAEVHEGPMTPEEDKASRWLTQWKKKIDAAASQ